MKQRPPNAPMPVRDLVAKATDLARSSGKGVEIKTKVKQSVKVKPAAGAKRKSPRDGFHYDHT